MSRRAPDHGAAPVPRALPAALVGACLATAVSAGALSACAPSGTVSAPAPSASPSGQVIGGAPGASTVPASTLLPGGGGAGAGDTTSTIAGAAPSTGGTGPASSVAAADGVGARIVGTDSDVTSASVAPADAGLQASLREFGRLYLGYDYRTDAAARADALRPYVTPELFTQLAAPMPAALVASLAAEQRVSEAAFVDIATLDAGVYRLRYDVHTTMTSGGRTVDAGPDQSRTLTVTVDAAQLVSDVR